MSNSCIGCKFFYGDGSDYSNYTWLETYARCALDKNINLEGKEIETPYDLDTSSPEEDKWPMTMDSRCHHYASGPYVLLDPDREDHPRETTTDEEQILAIVKHAGLD